jgi:hypothetical protein
MDFVDSWINYIIHRYKILRLFELKKKIETFKHYVPSKLESLNRCFYLKLLIIHNKIIKN